MSNRLCKEITRELNGVPEIRKVLVVGGGGHARVLIDCLLELGGFEIGVVEREDFAGSNVLGCPIVGRDPDLAKLCREGWTHAVIGVGSVGSPAARRGLDERLVAAGFQFLAVVHPKAAASRHCALGEGTVVYPCAVVNAGARLGRHCIVNTAAVVEHDCRLGDFVHVAPGAVLAGGVAVGDDVHIGAGAVIREGVKVGAGSIVGAGAVVVKDAPPGMIVTGVPARVLRAVGERVS